MKWLNSEEAAALPKWPPGAIQELIFSADLNLLKGEIPTTPLDEVSRGIGPEQFWLCLTGERIIMWAVLIESEKDGFVQVEIQTPFLSVSSNGDWKVLYEFCELLQAIKCTRPLAVKSRAKDLNHAVRRPNARGYSDAIYYATSRREAEEFLTFLKTDGWNENCYIGVGVPEGYWVALRDDGKQMCGYTTHTAAIDFACHMSLAPGHSGKFLIKNLSCPPERKDKEYHVFEGRVLPD